MSDNTDNLARLFEQNPGSPLVDLCARMIHKAYEAEGMRAFDNPKSATIVHEAGHVVVATDLGIKVRSTRIWKEETYWLGETLYLGVEMRTDQDTTPWSDFRWACVIMAGLVSEMTFDRANFRVGSSIDEVLLSKVYISNLARKTQRGEPEVSAEVFGKTALILRRNQSIVRAIARRLDMSGKLRRHELRPSLNRVTRHDPTTEGLGVVPPYMRRSG